MVRVARKIPGNRAFNKFPPIGAKYVDVAFFRLSFTIASGDARPVVLGDVRTSGDVRAREQALAVNP